ncbi:MAG: hypothetical protein M0Q43_03935 [Methanothrix sp.]|nr:hypothetical protein [Methanothrix sp.]
MSSAALRSDSLRQHRLAAAGPRGRAFSPLWSRLMLVGRTVRACGDVGRAGWLANGVHSASYLPVGPETLE